jgi:hypothetical protein
MGWMQNQLCGLANGINEMLLQSHSGVIHVFPAMPSTWRDAGFVNLRARPGVPAPAKRQDGKTRWVCLSAEGDRRIKVRSPWTGDLAERVVIVDRTSEDACWPAKVGEDGIIELSLKAGAPLMICLEGDAPADDEIDAPEEGTLEPWSFTGPIRIRPGDAEPDGTWTSWWGKP